MQIHEPMTMMTDYVLGGFSAGCGLLLFRQRDQPGRHARAVWGIALVAVGAAAIAGGTFHGLPSAFSPFGLRLLWFLVGLLIGTAALLLLTASTLAHLPPRRGRWIIGGAAAAFLVYAVRIVVDRGFAIVIIGYGVALLLVLLLELIGRSTSMPWIAGGFVISAAAAVVQQSPAHLGPLNHNDLFHLIQMVAIWLFFRGGSELRDHAPAGGTRETT